MIKQIVNPETGRKISIESQMGKRLLKKFIKQMGGVESDRATCFPNAENTPKEGDAYCIRAMDAGLNPNYDNDRYSLDNISDWLNKKNLTVHHYIEVISRESGCVFTYMLGKNADGNGSVFLSPDYVTSGCRKRTEECLEKQSKMEDYIYEKNGKKLTIVPSNNTGCNQVCIGIETIMDKNEHHGNNNLPRGFIVPNTQGHLTKAQVKILEYIHKNAKPNGHAGHLRALYLVAPFDYDLLCSIPGARSAKSASQVASRAASTVFSFFSAAVKKEEAFKQFANCQTFARDFAFIPVTLYSKLYPRNPDPQILAEKGALEIVAGIAGI